MRILNSLNERGLATKPRRPDEGEGDGEFDGAADADEDDEGSEGDEGDDGEDLKAEVMDLATDSQKQETDDKQLAQVVKNKMVQKGVGRGNSSNSRRGMANLRPRTKKSVDNPPMKLVKGHPGYAAKRSEKLRQLYADAAFLSNHMSENVLVLTLEDGQDIVQRKVFRSRMPTLNNLNRDVDFKRLIDSHVSRAAGTAPAMPVSTEGKCSVVMS